MKKLIVSLVALASISLYAGDQQDSCLGIVSKSTYDCKKIVDEDLRDECLGIVRD